MNKEDNNIWDDRNKCIRENTDLIKDKVTRIKIMGEMNLMSTHNRKE